MRKLITDESSSVRSLTFNPGDSPTLDVEFSDGRSYRYFGVTLDDFATACHAPSIGKWMNAKLKSDPDRHPYDRLPNAPRTVTRDDVERTALRVIATVSPTIPEAARRMNALALEALKQEPPPTLPAGFIHPQVVTQTGRIVVDLVAPARVMTPDEATAFAHALLLAASEARQESKIARRSGLDVKCPTCGAVEGRGCDGAAGPLTMGDYDAEFHASRRST